MVAAIFLSGTLMISMSKITNAVAKLTTIIDGPAIWISRGCDICVFMLQQKETELLCR